MVTSLEVTRALQQAGRDAKFVATGQTGILISGDGCPVDAVVSDFVNGAAEDLVIRNGQHEILVFEGQGSIAHPRFSAVTVGLLHGCAPHGLIVCCEIGREFYRGLNGVRIPALREIMRANETMANLLHPCQVLGISVNGSKVPPHVAEAEKEKLRSEFQLPVCDVYVDGPESLVQAVQSLERSRSLLGRLSDGG